MHTIGYFEIQSAEPMKAVLFYEALFGWTFIRQMQAPVEYYRIETGGISGGLLKRPALVPAPMSGTNAFVCSVQVENFDRMSAQILAAGGQIALPKFAIPGRCWQGYFIDPDQNTFGIFEADEQAK